MVFAETKPGRTQMSAQMTAGEHRPMVLHLVQLAVVDQATHDGKSRTGIVGFAEADQAGGRRVMPVDCPGQTGSGTQYKQVQRRVVVPDADFGAGQRVGQVVPGRDGRLQQNRGRDPSSGRQCFQRHQSDAAAGGMPDEMHRPVGIAVLVGDNLLGDSPCLAAVAVDVPQMNGDQKKRTRRPVIDFDRAVVAGVFEALRDVRVGEAQPFHARQDDRVSVLQSAGRDLIREVTASARTQQDQQNRGHLHQPDAPAKGIARR